MNQAIGNTAIVNVVVVFVIIISGLFVASLSYSKAYKVKNIILNAIEEPEGFDEEVKAEIEETLTEMGYRINLNGQQKCPTPNVDGTVEALNTASNHHYCVWRVKAPRGTYYIATSYVYFDIPLVDGFEAPVTGHTKTFYNDEAHD